VSVRVRVGILPDVTEGVRNKHVNTCNSFPKLRVLVNV
jgi:hypothetical protein